MSTLTFAHGQELDREVFPADVGGQIPCSLPALLSGPAPPPAGLHARRGLCVICGRKGGGQVWQTPVGAGWLPPGCVPRHHPLGRASYLMFVNLQPLEARLLEVPRAGLRGEKSAVAWPSHVRGPILLIQGPEQTRHVTKSPQRLLLSVLTKQHWSDFKTVQSILR